MSQSKAKLVLASVNPSQLADFYAFAMDAEIYIGLNDSHFSLINTEGFEMQIYKPSRAMTHPEKGRALSLCLQGAPSNNPLVVLKAWTRRLESKGASIISAPRVEHFGAEVWMLDPEQNAFILFVPLLL